MATRKPISQLSPAFRHRLEAYAATHPGADLDDPAVRKAARGHGYTPEHGSYLPHAYNDRTVYETASGQEARRLLNNMAKVDGLRVSIAVEEKAKPGYWHHLYSRHPIPAEWVMHGSDTIPDPVGRERNLKKWLEKQDIEAHGGTCPGFHVKNIRKIQITEYPVKAKAKAA